ncbi:MAG TPA: DUF5715 family protein [Longimicrobium sp.]|nr:DUF5715 family protein [Longimicrobium sp.]
MRTMLAAMAGLVLGVAVFAAPAAAPTLRGSPASMEHQHSVAVAEDFTFAATPREVEYLVARERLVPVKGSADYALARVSHPYARPEVLTFVERMGAQYRKACGEKLVVTSLTRPKAEQPGNAHRLSVHPAGMAVDFRISKRASCRKWMEETLLELEKKRLLDATRERNPPHYHVAVFPDAYRAYAARQAPVQRPTSPSPTVLRPRPAPSAPPEPAPAGQAERRTAPEPQPAAPPVVLVLLSSFALLFILGWRIARHHGPG